MRTIFCEQPTNFWKRDWHFLPGGMNREKGSIMKKNLYLTGKYDKMESCDKGDNMKNIVLIGMPGVGKSTIGVILAKELGYQFVDADLLIQKQEKRLLKEIISEEGIEGFIAIENQVNASIQTEHTVIATGGSVVYGKEAMEHLGEIATVIYLKLSYKALRKRLGNLKNRGVVLREGQTLKDLYEERTVLYEKYADLTIDEENKNLEETLQSIMDVL